MTPKILRHILAGLLVSVLAACGAPPEPNAGADTAYQTVAINTPGVDGVSCVVQARDATYQVSAPGTFRLPRLPGVMIVNCFKGDHLRGTAEVKASYAPREADVAAGCLSCNWPATVTVAMRLNDALMDVPVLRQGP